MDSPSSERRENEAVDSPLSPRSRLQLFDKFHSVAAEVSQRHIATRRHEDTPVLPPIDLDDSPPSVRDLIQATDAASLLPSQPRPGAPSHPCSPMVASSSPIVRPTALLSHVARRMSSEFDSPVLRRQSEIASPVIRPSELRSPLLKAPDEIWDRRRILAEGIIQEEPPSVNLTWRMLANETESLDLMMEEVAGGESPPPVSEMTEMDHVDVVKTYTKEDIELRGIRCTQRKSKSTKDIYNSLLSVARLNATMVALHEFVQGEWDAELQMKESVLKEPDRTSRLVREIENAFEAINEAHCLTNGAWDVENVALTAEQVRGWSERDDVKNAANPAAMVVNIGNQADVAMASVFGVISDRLKLASREFGARVNLCLNARIVELTRCNLKEYAQILVSRAEDDARQWEAYAEMAQKLKERDVEKLERMRAARSAREEEKRCAEEWKSMRGDKYDEYITTFRDCLITQKSARDKLELLGVTQQRIMEHLKVQQHLLANVMPPLLTTRAIHDLITFYTGVYYEPSVVKEPQLEWFTGWAMNRCPVDYRPSAVVPLGPEVGMGRFLAFSQRTTDLLNSLGDLEEHSKLIGSMTSSSGSHTVPTVEDIRVELERGSLGEYVSVVSIIAAQAERAENHLVTLEEAEQSQNVLRKAARIAQHESAMLRERLFESQLSSLKERGDASAAFEDTAQLIPCTVHWRWAMNATDPWRAELELEGPTDRLWEGVRVRIASADHDLRRWGPDGDARQLVNCTSSTEVVLRLDIVDCNVNGRVVYAAEALANSAAAHAVKDAHKREIPTPSTTSKLAAPPSVSEECVGFAVRCCNAMVDAAHWLRRDIRSLLVDRHLQDFDMEVGRLPPNVLLVEHPGKHGDIIKVGYLVQVGDDDCRLQLSIKILPALLAGGRLLMGVEVEAMTLEPMVRSVVDAVEAREASVEHFKKSILEARGTDRQEMMRRYVISNTVASETLAKVLREAGDSLQYR